MILFCLPYAGGSELIYSKWSEYISSDIKVVPIALKGRGRRFGEKHYNNMQEVVDDIYFFIKDKIDNENYALYGHSMGSVLAYELYYKVIKEQKRKPVHIFFSGRQAPNIPDKDKITYNLPDKEFMDQIIELGGIPGELLKNKELMEIFIPILKNDIRILEQYAFKDRKKKLECNISVINGTLDKIKFYQKIAWRDLCVVDCKLYDLQGNHFFINSNIENLAIIIEKNLLK